MSIESTADAWLKPSSMRGGNYWAYPSLPLSHPHPTADQLTNTTARAVVDDALALVAHRLTTGGALDASSVTSHDEVGRGGCVVGVGGSEVG